MRILWFTALGAAVGGILRVVLASAVQQRFHGDFPVGTLVVNVTGSLAIGVLLRYAMYSAMITPEMRALLVTGVCGGYTTFSTFSFESAVLIERGEYNRAALYVGTSVVLSLLFTFVGFAAAQRILMLRQQG